jgi:hypothetical protein
MRPSRARGGTARTLSAAELEHELNRMISIRGQGALNELRDQARALSERLGMQEQFAAFDDLVGALQGTRNAPLATSAARAARGGQPYDVRRLDLFGGLQSALERAVPEQRYEDAHDILGTFDLVNDAARRDVVP